MDLFSIVNGEENDSQVVEVSLTEDYTDFVKQAFESEYKRLRRRHEFTLSEEQKKEVLTNIKNMVCYTMKELVQGHFTLTAKRVVLKPQVYEKKEDDLYLRQNLLFDNFPKHEIRVKPDQIEVVINKMLKDTIVKAAQTALINF